MADGIAVDGTNVSYGVPDHTIGCMFIPACLNSGFTVRRQLSPNAPYTTAYNLSNSSIPTVSAFLKTLTRPANAYAKVRADC